MNEDTVTRLKKKRGTVRSSVTKQIKNIESELENESRLDVLEESLELLTEYAKELESLDSEIENLIDTRDLDADLNTASEYREKIIVTKFKAKKKINVLNKSIQSETTPDSNFKNKTLECEFQDKVQIKLPKLSINKFYGEISQWLSFWNSFESAIHNNISLDNISKFNYLKAHLGGTALHTIEGYAITAENYDKAVKMLENRFGRKEVLINTHMSNILNIPPLKHSNDIKSFRKFYDSIQTEQRSLESLNVLSNTYSTLLCPMLLKMLPPDLILEFNKEIKDSAYEIESLIDFLSEQLIARERAFFSTGKTETEKYSYTAYRRHNSRFEGEAVATPSLPPDSRQNFSDESINKRMKKTTAADLLSSELNKNKSLSCAFCNKSHESVKCKYASNLSLDERKSLLLKKGACFKCLSIGHVSKKCVVKIICDICKRNHASIMCFYFKNKKPDMSLGGNNENNRCDNNVLANNSCSKEVLLQTLIVYIKENNLNHFLRIIIDTGSQKSYISKYVAEIMNLKSIGEEVITHGLFGGVEKSVKHKKYCIKLSNIDKSFTFDLEVMDQKRICTSIPKLKSSKCINELKMSGIFLSDVAINENCCLYENDPNEIHVLLGADYASKVFTGEIKYLSEGLLAMKTKLGWTVLGKAGEKEAKNSNVLLSLHVSNFDISEYWSLDSIGIHDPGTKMMRSELETAAKNHFLSTITRDEEGRYIVSLPWIEDHPPLSNCRNIAEKRLANCVTSLKRIGRLSSYEEVFRDWLVEGIIEEVHPSNESQNEHFLPHRPIFKSNSTTKVRPVFDGSAREKDSPSLNDCLEKGPNLIELIPTIINKFRFRKYGVIADIEKAFLQIGLQEKDRPFLKFLWWGQGDREKLKIFQHKRVVFGISSSPFLLGATIDYILDEKRVPTYFLETARKLRGSFYVDNCVLSVDSSEELVNLIPNAQALLHTAKMNLRGWEFSPCNLMPDESTQEERIVPVLGLNWKLPKDTLAIDTKDFAKDDNPPLTKRKILSAVHRIFDPIGFTCPLTLIPKLLLQECWKEGISWDSELPVMISKKFERWKKELGSLKEIEIPRYLLKESSTELDLSMHVFCDASKSAYATCIFLRAADKTKTTCQLIQARTRVAPLKAVSIPRLELLACTIAARLAHTTRSEMGLENIPITYWSDSVNALYWIKGTENWATFVYNRVQEIRRLTDPDDWRHIAGTFNPADLPSRGCNPDELLNIRWWEGPSWLKLTPNEWPNSKIEPNLEIVNSEKKKTIVSAINNESDILQYAKRISSYRRIVRIMAWLRRFAANCKDKEHRKSVELELEEINEAEKIIFKMIQHQTIDKQRKLNLQTFIDPDGLIRVKTRIAQREDLEAFRYPILLPSDHPIVKKLIYEKHIELCHSGLQFLMSNLRETFWIIKSRKTIRQVIRECIKCKRFDSRPLENASAPLPKERVRDAFAFEVTGLDLAGPLYLKNDSKCWIVLFTCAVYRAVHLELVTSLSTDNLLLALRRFISRRGRPSTIFSDNGTNLVGASNELKAVDWENIEKYTTLKKISWKLNPPSAPWWGGFWERLIGILKRILRKVIGNACLEYEELYTILCDAESIINSRPLTYLSEDGEDLVALTPAMFIQEIRETGVADIDQIDAKKLKKRIAYKSKLCQDLRQRFRNEYLGQLKEFYKDYKECHVNIGDIVLIGDTNSKRIHWPLARVIKTFPGKDGKIRLVQLQTNTGTFLRPIQRLYPLEVYERSSLPKTLPTLSPIPKKDVSDEEQLDSSSSPVLPSPLAASPEVEPILPRSRYGRVLRPTNKMNL